MSYLFIAIALLFSGGYNSSRKAGIAEFQAGHYAQAEALIRTALESARAANDQYAEGLSHCNLGDALQAEGRAFDAEKEYRAALAIFNQSGRDHAAAIAWRNLASDLTAQGQYREARNALKEAMKVVARSKIQDATLNSEISNSLGVIQFNEGEIDKAENSFNRAAAFVSEASWQVSNNLGHVYQARRQYARAEHQYQNSLQLAKTRLGSAHPSVAFVHNNLGSLYLDTVQYSDAAKEFEQSLAILERSDTSFDDGQIMHTLYQLARAHLAQHQEAQAQPLLARASAIARKHSASVDLPEAAEIFAMYSRVLKDQSKLSEAEHADADARRVRGTMAFTVPLATLK